MFLTPYFSNYNQQFKFTRKQASYFAKKVAGDYNPIHDEHNKRFCVPGDLLFAVFLQKKGISQKMRFDFAEMVNDRIALQIENKSEQKKSVVDKNGKEYLHITHDGNINYDEKLIECLVVDYVQFSGMSFPEIMVPLMEKQKMMISCNRPLVIYESMEIEFNHLNLIQPKVEFLDATFDVVGKRAFITLNFIFKENKIIVGKGIKRMIAGGLRPYVKKEVDDLINHFNKRKDIFLSKLAA
ncbi:hypothetical protein CF66_2281 [Candidatus Photodesmus katoptron]|uniref:DUF3581 domain-containing protein n=1 Tax=Candidatus Photodesmus katoptron Akat1 TaxID=1236703 RepID=S3DGU3_9GAMM|nr:DUF3581 family protein [Candidatus Photodesmus katoptron]EPE37687.1 hypothetical protein O1U_0146 [Candidatus Photodesmus katoptron Akat1]KEY90592.1 hypothetical protein CF66_2281 [Candidatus Photodesmus katoptron]